MHDRGIGHGARQRPGIDIVAVGIARRVVGHGAQGRLEANQARTGGGTAHRARAVGAERQGAEARRHRGRAAAARTAGRTFEVPGVARHAERPVGQAFHAELGRGRFGEDDGAGLAQALHQQIVCGRRAVALEDRRAMARRHALDIDQVLHADRHAVQRAQNFTACDGFLGLLRVVPGLLDHDFAEAVDFRVGALGGLQHRVEIFDGRKLLRADEGGGLNGRGEEKICVGHGTHHIGLQFAWECFDAEVADH